MRNVNVFAKKRAVDATVSPPEVRHELSRDINARVIDFIEAQAIETVMLYLSMGSEVETSDLLAYLLRADKIALAPTIEAKRLVPRRITDTGTQLVRHRYGMLQPNQDVCPKFPVNQINLIIVPGIAFDSEKISHWIRRRVLRSIPAEMSPSNLDGIGVQGTSHSRYAAASMGCGIALCLFREMQLIVQDLRSNGRSLLRGKMPRRARTFIGLTQLGL